MTLPLRLKKNQMKIFNSPKRFVVVNAGRRFGKSYVSGAKALVKLVNQNNKTVIYVAPTQTMARNIMWDNWMKKHLPAEYIERKNEQLMTIQLKNGSMFYCLSAENPDRLRGLAADLLIVDECASIDNSFYDIVRPVLSDKHHDGEALYISTPAGFNWFYDRYQKALQNPDKWDCFQFTTLDGENVTEEEIEEARRDLSPRMFAQEYLASFECMANRIYESFDRDKNRCIREDYWGKTDIHVGIDFNVNPMTAVISVFEKKHLYIFDEIVEPNSNTTELSKILKRKYPDADIYVYPDPTGDKNQTNGVTGLTDLEILRQAGFTVCAPRRRYKEKDKFNTVNLALLNAKGERRVFVSEGSCPNLKKAWEGYSRKPDGTPDKNSGLDHISDAAAYLICYLMPFLGTTKISKPRTLGV